MALKSCTYGKGRVRVMRLARDGDHHAVRELSVEAMLQGNLSRAYTHADNSGTVSTDTIKNLINIVARENLALDNEAFCRVVARRLLDRYAFADSASVTAHETRWVRLLVDGQPHPHSFTLDGNGRPFASVAATRGGMVTTSGIDGFTFMKSTQSGWADYIKDDYTTIPETHDRLCATSMEASWRWTSDPADFREANALLLRTMLKVFATTYSASVQDSLYRMGEAALEAVPEVAEISMACPNKHYLLINLKTFDLDNENVVFLPTDEPHGQIECTVGRG